MVGSSASVSGANVVLNTAVAESLKQFADALEGKENFEEELHELIKNVIKTHKRIIFNGNSYDDAWMEEAEKRGLLNLRTTPDCLPCYIAPKNLELFANHKVFTPLEVNARYEIKTDIYCKNISIEARTMIDMVKKDILPAITKFTSFLSGEIIAKTNISKDINIRYEAETLEKLSDLTGAIYETVKVLENVLSKANGMCSSNVETAFFYKDSVIPVMNELRKYVDTAEGMTKRDMWPYPTYDNLLFLV
jgi:glutamine synthetase